MWRDLAVFAGAFAVSAALPGPDTMLLFTCALAGGARAAGTVAVGLTVGKLVLLSTAVAGVAAAAAALGPLFVVLKVAGGGYLVWLAVRLWRRATPALPTAPEQAAAGARLAHVGTGCRGIWWGAALTVGNPQALLFYVAVLPAVLNSKQVGLQEYLLLCAIVLAAMATVAGAYITLATRLRAALSASGKRVAHRVGAVLLGLTGAVVIAR